MTQNFYIYIKLHMDLNDKEFCNTQLENIFLNFKLIKII